MAAEDQGRQIDRQIRDQAGQLQYSPLKTPSGIKALKIYDLELD
jgi:hypothetical protein